MTPSVGPCLTQGHDWQDLCRASHDIATYQIYKLWVLRFQRRRFYYVFLLQAYGSQDNDTPGVWPVWTPGVGMVGRIYEEEYTQKMKPQVLVVSEKFCFMFVPFLVYGSPGEGPFLTPGALLAGFI